MKILRQQGVYSLIELDRDDTQLKYYIDNGDAVSEYFDSVEMVYYMTLDRNAFVRECEDLFD